MTDRRGMRSRCRDARSRALPDPLPAGQSLECVAFIKPQAHFARRGMAARSLGQLQDPQVRITAPLRVAQQVMKAS